MDTTRFILANIVVSNLIRQGVDYFGDGEPGDVYEPPIEVEVDRAKAADKKETPEPSWFLPYLLGIQISVLYLFTQTVRKYELPSGRVRGLLIALISSDSLCNLLDVLQFALYANYGVELLAFVSTAYYGTISYMLDVLQHFSVGLHLLLCGDVSNMLPSGSTSAGGLSLFAGLLANALLAPLTFDIPCQLDKVSRFTEYRDLVIDTNYAQRLSSLHLLPCLGLAIIYIYQRMQKRAQRDMRDKSPNEKGDEGVSVLNVRTFILRSMICHYVISLIYCFITFGVKMRQDKLIKFISQFDSPDNTLRKFGYLQQAANTVCLLACLNLESASGDSTLMVDELEQDFQQPASVFAEEAESELD